MLIISQFFCPSPLIDLTDLEKRGGPEKDDKDNKNIMIQKERARLLKLMNEVAEIFHSSSQFREQLDKVTRALQNLISI